MHERISVNMLTFADQPLATIMEHARELKPHRLSFFTASLTTAGLEDAKRQLVGAGYGYETITHPFMTGPISNREAWEGARKNLSEAIRIGAAVGAKSLYMLTGGHGDLVWEEAAETFSEAIAPCRDEAKAVGLKLMIEPGPMLYADNHLAHSLPDTLRLAEIADIGVCFDIFSCAWEAGLKETIQRAASRIHLVQVGDLAAGSRIVPSRVVPGDGLIPFKRIIGWVLETGYDGAFDLEMLGPKVEEMGRMEALKRTAERTSEILESLGA